MDNDRLFSHLLINNFFNLSLIKTQINWQLQGSIIVRLTRWWFGIEDFNGLYVSITQMYFFGKDGAPAYFDIGLINQYLKIFGRLNINVGNPNTIT